MRRIFQFIEILLTIKYPINYDGNKGVENVIELLDNGFLNSGSGEETENAIQESRSDDHHVLLEDVFDHYGVFSLGFSAVREQDPTNVFELTYGVVGSYKHEKLAALLSQRCPDLRAPQ